MNRKIRVGIIFGGKSAEHEVSLLSAQNIIDALDKERYEPVLIGIDKKGKWLLSDRSQSILHGNDPKLIQLNAALGPHVALVPQSDGKITHLDTPVLGGSVDVVFPILHGPFGEDGTIQGLLKLANVPFVGAGVLGSAVGMDKDVMKRLLRDAGIPIANFLAFRQKDVPTFEQIGAKLGVPFFVKPANLGSSVGVNKVQNHSEFAHALAEAFAHDHKILIEEYIEGREIECAVLGNDDPIVSVPGEIRSTHDFYSYEAKYIDEHGASLIIPAHMSEEITKRLQDLAIQTFKTLACAGLGRVDFFLKKNGEIVVNEINTMPGFTSSSMYPKLWEATGISYAALIDRLLQLAFERFEAEQRLKTAHD